MAEQAEYGLSGCSPRVRGMALGAGARISGPSCAPRACGDGPYLQLVEVEQPPWDEELEDHA